MPALAVEPVYEILDAMALLRASTTVAAIGPLTNVADVLVCSHTMEQLVMMRGDITSGKPEHNVSADVAAAQALFASGVPAVVTGIDQTERIVLGESASCSACAWPSRSSPRWRSPPSHHVQPTPTHPDRDGHVRAPFHTHVLAHDMALLVIGQVARGIAIAVIGAAGIDFPRLSRIRQRPRHNPVLQRQHRRIPDRRRARRCEHRNLRLHHNAAAMCGGSRGSRSHLHCRQCRPPS
jgi:hypothetical protein